MQAGFDKPESKTKIYLGKANEDIKGSEYVMIIIRYIEYRYRI